MSSKCTKSIFINTELERNQVFSEVNDTHVVELDETRKNVLNSKFWEIGTSYSHETGQHSLKVNTLENFTMARNLAVCPWRNIHDLVNLPNYVDLHVFPSHDFERFLSHCLILNDQEQTAKSFDIHHISNKGSKVSFECMGLAHR